MKKLFILGLISLSISLPINAFLNSTIHYGDEDEVSNNPTDDAQNPAISNGQQEQAAEKQKKQKLINEKNIESFKQNNEFSSDINKLYKAFFNSDYDGAGFSTQVDFKDDPWNKLAPAIFASKLSLNSADLKPRLGGLSNWVRQLFGGQKLTPEQRFKERLIQALIKKAIEYINYQNTHFKGEYDKQVKNGYVNIIKELSNAFATKDFDIKNINKLYKDIVGKAQDSFLNEPEIILANLNLILSLNSTKDNSDKSINFSEAFKSLYRDTASNIFKAMKNLVINNDGKINTVAWNAEDYTKISFLILDQLPSVALKKALIELSKANSRTQIDGLNINDLVKQIIDNPNAKALKGNYGKLLIRFEANQGGISEGGESAVNPTRTIIEIPHELPAGSQYDNPDDLPVDG